MAAKLIDGNAIAKEIRERAAHDAESLRRSGIGPSLVALLVGDDAAAKSYANSQRKHAETTGITYRLLELPANSTQAVVKTAIKTLNADPSVSGIMLHLPLPKGLDAFALQQCIAPIKDVEGVGAANLGLLAMGRDALAPCTAAAAMACLKSTGVTLSGAEAVVLGRSVIVGKPLALLLVSEHATVTMCHTRTKDLVAHTRRADVLLIAAGVAGLIGAEHVRPGAIVIDVGTNRVPGEDGKLKTVGDVRFDEVAPIAAAINPVPGGVGPVTVAMLLANTVNACQRQQS